MRDFLPTLSYSTLIFFFFLDVCGCCVSRMTSVIAALVGVAVSGNVPSPNRLGFGDTFEGKF